MVRKITDDIEIENARLIFKNFRGEESKYNRLWARNFCVVIDDPEEAKQLSADGWNIKELKSRDPEDEPEYCLKVNVAYGSRSQPRITMIVGNKRVTLDEDTVSCLDFAEIISADVILRPYNYEVRGESGVSAYLRTMYVTIREDKFAAKYEHLEGDSNDSY